MLRAASEQQRERDANKCACEGCGHDADARHPLHGCQRDHVAARTACHEHQYDAERRACCGAEQVWVSQWIAKQALRDRAREPKQCANQQRAERSRRADLAED